MLVWPTSLLPICPSGRPTAIPDASISVQGFSAKSLSEELNTNTRYISAVINSRFNTNFSCLINEYRIKEALHKMKDKRYADMTIEEIGNEVGFANRQSFYASFYRIMGETPNSYRKRNSTSKV